MVKVVTGGRNAPNKTATLSNSATKLLFKKQAQKDIAVPLRTLIKFIIYSSLTFSDLKNDMEEF